ncbi:MAG: hypothetical protein A3F72_20390 [Bacteroidetes bacterium RIFCSPLOWO2_12_FULL_35_15]|nr:MAG: hypothetical protein A3F72_20390 [Bacteroidetes bacterium RIFCSPLOWO2_12_FULL_35_15]
MTRQKRLSVISVLLLIILTFPFLISAFKTEKITDNDLKIEHKKTKSGYNYTIFYKNNFKLDVSLTRPEKTDNTILLCLPGAYTDLQTYMVDGLYIDNGKVLNKNKINHSLGGAIKIIDGECVIFPTNKGKLLTDSLINFVVAKKGSLFQQIQMIEKGVGAKYKDVKLFQRRAIVKFKDNKTAVIECYENITLSVFTTDLLELGVADAIYTDMGAWDEGWYRNPSDKKIITIGRMKTQTDKQCNWVVFKTKYY